jgi:hypothetical protein
MEKVPRSPLDQTGGMSYFPRMLDKMRLFAAGELRPDLHANLGKFVDGWCTSFLRVDYAALQERVLAGGTDEELLDWCYANGRQLNETDLIVWNSFVSKLGWRDAGAVRLARLKSASGLAHRDDLVTMADYMEVDEGRKS